MVVAVLLFMATPVISQVTNFSTEGNLQPRYDPPCLTLDEVQNDYSPADLAVSLRKCFAGGDDVKAAELLILLQLRGELDRKRVKDETAHGAYQVLSQNVAGEFPDEWRARMASAFESFGDTGSPKHDAFCTLMRKWGPPAHSPDYMIQHGLGAFRDTTEGNGLVEGFNPDAAWNGLLSGYIKCSG